MSKCKYCYMTMVAQGDEGCWGKEWVCDNVKAYDGPHICDRKPEECPNAVLVD